MIDQPVGGGLGDIVMVEPVREARSLRAGGRAAISSALPRTAWSGPMAATKQ